MTPIGARDRAVTDLVGHGIAGRIHGVTGMRMDTDRNSFVIPALEPGSIAGKGSTPHRPMDPGSEAGMTAELVTTVEVPSEVTGDLNRTAVDQVRGDNYGSP